MFSSYFFRFQSGFFFVKLPCSWVVNDDVFIDFLCIFEKGILSFVNNIGMNGLQTIQPQSIPLPSKVGYGTWECGINATSTNHWAYAQGNQCLYILEKPKVKRYLKNWYEIMAYFWINTRYI